MEDETRPPVAEQAPPDASPPAEVTEPTPPPAPPVGPQPEPVQYATEYERLLALARDASPGTILEDDPAKPFRIGVWGPEGRKLPNLCCRQCKFAILANRTGSYARQFMEHWVAKHEEEEDEPPAGRSGLIDASGRPL